MKRLLTLLFLVPTFLTHAQTQSEPDLIKQIDSLLSVSRKLTSSEQYDAAAEVVAQAEKRTLEGSGEQSLAFGKVCAARARIFQKQGKMEDAEKSYLRGIDILQKTDGPDFSHAADAMFSLAALYYRQQEFQKALPWYRECASIRKKSPGKESTAYADAVQGTALAEDMLGNYDEAEPLYRESEKIYLKAEGPLGQNYASTITKLADLYKNIGDYAQAERLYTEYMDIQARTKGKDHPDYAFALGDMARFLVRTGEHAKAEAYYLEAKRIFEANNLAEEVQFAWLLNNMGVMYGNLGNKARAIQYYNQAMDIYVKKRGREYRGCANTLSNLGGIYIALGDTEKAISCLNESIAIFSKVYGEDNPNTADPMSALGGFYLQQGDLVRAEDLLQKVHRIVEKSYGKQSPDYASSLESMSALYEYKSDFKKAESCLLESRDVYAGSRGTESQSYLSTVNELADFYYRTRRIPESNKQYLESNRLNRRMLEKAAAYASENEMRLLLETFNDHLATFQSFAQRYPNPELSGELFNNALFFNGLVLENDRLLSRALGRADSLTRDIYLKWQGCHRRLAKRYARPATDRKKITEVEAEAEDYEKMLKRRLPEFSETRKTPRWQDLRDRLHAGEAVVEFIRYPYCKPEPTDSFLYSALVLQPGCTEPLVVPLFEEKSLDSLLVSNGERKADYVAGIYSVADRGVVATGKPLRSLYELIWKPLESKLPSTSTVYFSPAGLLHRLNLPAIPFSADSTLADRYHFIEMGSTRQLVSNTEATRLEKGDKVLLYGGIQYEMDSTAMFAALARQNNSDAMASRGAPEPDSSARGGTSWNYLKWTEKEVNAIQALLSSAGLEPVIRKGFDATEESFKLLGVDEPAPKVLHIATHGFFFPDPSHKSGSATEQEVGFKSSNNPLIRSGLLLAGANYAWNSGKPFKKTMENGILTAYEISHLDLSNTELVVLSACETGLGDIEGNEGVFGLQRAFKIAGVRYLIMSLWQVPDFQTQELMTTFYGKWLLEKMPIPAAFHKAQQELREKYQNPYFWAGFVLME